MEVNFIIFTIPLILRGSTGVPAEASQSSIYHRKTPGPYRQRGLRSMIF